MSTSATMPISQLTTQPNPADQMPGTQTSSSGSDLSPNAFLQLLTTEMMNQDPTQPEDPTQSVTQLAQFSALQYQQQLTSAFQGFQSNFAVLQAASLVGKQVTVSVTDSSGNAQNESGTIDTIEVQNGQPFFTMTNPSTGSDYADNNGNPLLFSLQQILGIGAGTTAGSTGNTGTTPGGSGGSGS